MMRNTQMGPLIRQIYDLYGEIAARSLRWLQKDTPGEPLKLRPDQGTGKSDSRQNLHVSI